MKKAAAIALISLLSLLLCMQASFATKKPPFSGLWVSKQYTNGKEFHLKLQQIDDELIGWEGRLPANIDELPPDLKGNIKGKSALVEVEHRRGYKAHAKLTLQNGKLVWQLTDADNKSSRYFPIASTLQRRDEDVTANSAKTTTSGDQLLWDLLSRADSFDTGTIGEGAQTSPYFNAFRALVSHTPKLDDRALQALLKSSSAAGRLYAACILWELDRNAGLQAFNSLLTDNAAVNYRSGCEVMATNVAEVARSFVEKGSFLDFPSKRY